MSNPNSLIDTALDAQEVLDLAKEDLDFFTALAMPETFEYCWPPVFQTAWGLFKTYIHKSKFNTTEVSELFANLAIGLPRGFAKTTFVKLTALYTVLYTDRRFLLVLANTASHARNIISDIIDMLDEPNIKAVFGDWRLGVETDNQDVKKFGFRGRNVIIAGVGAGGSVRGLNLKNARPDFMIFEDIQSREDADSATVSDALYRWMLGTAMKAKAPSRCLTIFIANMYPTPYSILKKLKQNPQWLKFIAGGILEDGTSLWEELHPIKKLLAEYQADAAAGHPEIFLSEVMNDEHASVNNLVDMSELPAYPYEDDDIPIGRFIVIDPSNDKHNSDAVSIGYFEVQGDSIPCLMELIEGRLSPGDTIKSALGLCEKHGCTLVVIEANAYQYSLLYWSDFITQQLGVIGIEFVPIYSGKLSKSTRILNMFKQYRAGELYVHERCKASVNMQIGSYRPLKTDNIDGVLDLLTYAPRVVSEFGEYLTQQTLIGEQEWNSKVLDIIPQEQLSSF